MVTYAEIIASAPRSEQQKLTALPPIQNPRSPDVCSPPLIRRQLSLFLKRQPSTERPNIMRFASTASNPRRRQRGKLGGDLKNTDGTVLHALPKSNEEDEKPQTPETPSASNDEIVNSILKSHPEAIDAMSAHSIPQYSPPTPKQLSPKRSKKERKCDQTSHIIGVYKDGKITWKSQSKSDGQIPFVSSASQAFYHSSKTPSLSEHRLRSSSSLKRTQRPKIEVIIPSDQQRSEFTRGPLLRSSRSAPGPLSANSDSASSFEVSPASTHTGTGIRTSISPIVPPHRALKPRRPLNKRAPTTVYECEDEEDDTPALPTSTGTNKDPPETGNSITSNESNDTNNGAGPSPGARSSVYSDENSSMSSLEPEPLVAHKLEPLPVLRNSVTRMFSLDSPLPRNNLKPLQPETKSIYAPEVVVAPTTDENRPPTPPPKGQVIEIALEIVEPLPPRQYSQEGFTRNSPNAKRISQRAGRVSKRRSSLPQDIRSPSKQMKPSPTLSEVERELQEQLMSTTTEDPFKWDQVNLPEGADVVFTPQAQTTSESVRKLSDTPSSGRGSPSNRLAVSTSHIASQALSSLKQHSNSTASASPVAELPGDSPIDSPPQNMAIELPAELNIPELPTSSTPRDERRKSRLEELQKSVGKLVIPTSNSTPVTEVIPAPRCEAEKQLQEGPTPEQAEDMVAQIFRSLHDLDDLFNTALISHAFYGVFKRHELDLVRDTLWKTAPAAWEFREMTVPETGDDGTPDSAQPLPEYDAVSYYASYKRDLQVIVSLKQLILIRCKNFLRPETREALESEDKEVARHINDAFWRIWTFCRLFGSGRGREQDVVAQIDWLKGGQVANQQECVSTVITRDSLALSDFLLMAPEGFGLGNPGGLSAEQLYDMTELWTCLGVLIQGLEGRTEQARQYGVYDATGVEEDDVEGEERVLEEWYYYVLTLGLNAVLELGEDVTSEEPTAFEKAQQRGWVKWTPPEEKQTRGSFLKDAVSRVYEEKISNHLAINAPQRQEMREITRERIQGHAAEIKLRKQAGDIRMIRMSQERPMSDWTNVMQVLDANGVSSFPMSPRSIGWGSRTHSRRNSSISDIDGAMNQAGGGTGTFMSERIVEEEEPTSAHDVESRQPAMHTRFDSTDSVSSTQPDASSNSNIHPLLRPQGSTDLSERRSSAHSGLSEHSAQSNAPSAADHQHPLQYSMGEDNDPAEDTANKAIFRIVEMGFTAEEAKHALRVTDMGDGLRIDRAVELLLRRYEG